MNESQVTLDGAVVTLEAALSFFGEFHAVFWDRDVDTTSMILAKDTRALGTIRFYHKNNGTPCVYIGSGVDPLVYVWFEDPVAHWQKRGADKRFHDRDMAQFYRCDSFNSQYRCTHELDHVDWHSAMTDSGDPLYWENRPTRSST